jgi:hypothetical protein
LKQRRIERSFLTLDTNLIHRNKGPASMH